MSDLRLYLLGPPRIERNGLPLELHRHKNVALIAYLAVTGERHTREALVTLLWPELEPSRARAGLRRNLSALRKALGKEWLHVDRESVGLHPEVELWLDVERFRDLLRSDSDNLEALEEAVALYRGDFLEGFSLPDSTQYDDWQFFQSEGLRQELADALERLVRGYRPTVFGRSAGAYERAIPHARRWVALDPLHEPAQQALMLAYAGAGRRAAALRQYEACVRVLEEELGLLPSPETTALYQRIRAGRVHAGDVWPERVRAFDTEAEQEPAAASSPTLPSNLPVQATRFVGRTKERAELVARLRDPECRLLTVVGPGGIGKTRLALQVAEDLVAAGSEGPFPQGIWFVPLVPVRTPEGIVSAIAQALGLSLEGGAPWQQLLDYLQQRSMLLVLDSIEHLLAEHLRVERLPAGPEPPSDEGIDLVSEVLKTAPRIKILVTSRAYLNAQGECLVHLDGMDFPQPMSKTSPETLGEALGYGAVQLFLQGARRVRSDFELGAEEVEHVSRICHLVQGMPLGILLAAAWVEMLSLDEIAAEIQRSLDFLEADWRDAPERQRSIRAVYDHSWNLLTEREREVCRSLSVFRGTFSRVAAQAVAGASLRELMLLARRSLLHRMPTGRYEVHELLRQYAEEKLEASPAAAEAVRDR